MKILLIEDDKDLAWTIKIGLEENNYVVDWVINGVDGSEMAQAYSYDAIILDLVLPLRDGFTVCREIRNRGIKTPILMLTARSLEGDRVHGLDLGADDYMVKPFSYPELYARIRALIRRANNVSLPLLTIGELVIDTVKKNVTYRGNDVRLTAQEYVILEYLAFNKNAVITRKMLEEHLWGCESGAYSNVAEVLISRIRKKLCYEDKEAVIKTVKGLGYVVKDC